MTIGEKITKSRTEAGLSQYALAKKSEITSQAINQYESGKRVPDLKCFISICRGLNTSMDSLMDGVTM